MKLPSSFTYALLIIALLAFMAFGVSKFVQPMLPSGINSDLFLLMGIFLVAAGLLSSINNAMNLVERLSSGVHLGKNDVYISYKYQEESDAKSIAQELRTRGLKTWLFPEQVLAGSDWPSVSKEALRRSKSFVFLIGRYGIGQGQESELQWATILPIRIIPVLLPGASSAVAIARDELRNRLWVRLSSLNDKDALDQLARGI